MTALNTEAASICGTVWRERNAAVIAEYCAYARRKLFARDAVGGIHAGILKHLGRGCCHGRIGTVDVDGVMVKTEYHC